MSEYGALRIRAMLLGDQDAYRELMARMSENPDALPGDLAAAKAALAGVKAARAASPHLYPADFDWAVEQLELAWQECDRLRGLLARLEWAGAYGESGALPCCPSCTAIKPGPHGPTCWLADALHPENANEPPQPEG